MSVPFKSDNEEINRLIAWVNSNFDLKGLDRQTRQRKHKDIGDIPERDMEERELRIRDNQGTIELLTKWNGGLKKINFDDDSKRYAWLI